MNRWLRALMLLCLSVGFVTPAVAVRTLPDFQPNPQVTRHLSRTLARLRTSAQQPSPPFRVLFYGQSITLQGWTIMLRNSLLAAYPGAQIHFENRAISGFQADRLAVTAVTDVLSWQPDLVILQCYGLPADTDRLVGLIRQGTTADILVQQDHPHLEGQLDEETDPERIPASDWWAQRNYVWLPEICARHQACFASVRDVWKSYLRMHGLGVSDLIRDSVHPNMEGEQLLALILLGYLTAPPPTPQPDPFDLPQVRLRRTDVSGVEEPYTLIVPFAGQRIDLVVSSNLDAGGLGVAIDGRPPSSLPELVGFSRTTYCIRAGWPAIQRITSRTPRVPEDWALTFTQVSTNGEVYNFRLEGTQTGFDGEGTSDRPFVSNSGRVQIDPSDWLLPYDVRRNHVAPQVGFRVAWKAEMHGLDRMDPGPGQGFSTRSVTLADGLAEGRHELRLTASDAGSVSHYEFIAYSPMGEAWLTPDIRLDSAKVTAFTIRRKSTRTVLHWPEDALGYQLQWTQSLFPEPQWETLPVDLPPRGSPFTYVVPAALPQGFYRLVTP